MFVNQQVPWLEYQYGVPRVFTTEWEMREKEFNLVCASMLSGRQHDVTLLIFQQKPNQERQITPDAKLAVIRKPYYLPNVYRPPSGGISPGEVFEQGVKREAKEETGLEIRLHRYLLRAYVQFSYQSQQVEGIYQIDWQTHVFTASTTSLNILPTDTQEIAGAKWATWRELGTSLMNGLQHSDATGLQYRASLQAEILKSFDAIF